MDSFDELMIVRCDENLGGSQRVAALWQELFPNSLLITLSCYSDSKNVIGRIVKRNFGLLKEIRKRRPKVVIVFMPNTLITIVPLMLLHRKIKWVYRESNLVNRWQFFQNRYLRALYKLALNSVCKIIVQSQEMYLSFENLGLKRRPCTISNFFWPVDIPDRFPLNPYRNNCIWLGRFCEQKDPSYALDMFARKAIDSYDELHFYGEGTLENEIRRKAFDLGISDRVRFFPPTKDRAIYSKYSLLIFSSVYEGFPNTILEALMFGLGVYSREFQGGFLELREFITVEGEDDFSQVFPRPPMCSVSLAKYRPERIQKVISEKVL